MSTQRVRLFAGPNGSGKSTIKSLLPTPLLGRYINPDELEAGLRGQLRFRFADWQLTLPDETYFRTFFESHPLAQRMAGTAPFAGLVLSAEGYADFSAVPVNSYTASILADWLRRAFLLGGQSFTFETVMSSPDKIEVLRQAQQAGFRCYLYYVATDDPAINIARVEQRRQAGGHYVEPDKVVSRYYRSLDLLLDAIRFTDRAYLFDNTVANREIIWLAEVTGGRVLDMKVDQVPAWFETYVLQKIS